VPSSSACRVAQTATSEVSPQAPCVRASMLRRSSTCSGPPRGSQQRQNPPPQAQPHRQTNARGTTTTTADLPPRSNNGCPIEKSSLIEICRVATSCTARTFSAGVYKSPPARSFTIRKHPVRPLQVASCCQEASGGLIYLMLPQRQPPSKINLGNQEILNCYMRQRMPPPGSRDTSTSNAKHASTPLTSFLESHSSAERSCLKPWSPRLVSQRCTIGHILREAGEKKKIIGIGDDQPIRQARTGRSWSFRNRLRHTTTIIPLMKPGNQS